MKKKKCMCKVCVAARHRAKEWYRNHREDKIKYAKKYNKKHKKEIREYSQSKPQKDYHHNYYIKHRKIKPKIGAIGHIENGVVVHG